MSHEPQPASQNPAPGPESPALPDAGADTDPEINAHAITPKRDLLPLPGLAAIALYLVALAAVIVIGVVSGRHYPPIFLVFSALFFAAACGLLMLFRWAWAMALAAVLLLAIYNMLIAVNLRQPPSVVQSLLNLVFFLYLVRPEVREKLR